MAISAGNPTRSVRGYGDLVIVGGEAHRTGGTSATPERFEGPAVDPLPTRELS